jgi:hypothetical protein
MNSGISGRIALQGCLAWITGTVGGASLGMVLGVIGAWLVMLPLLLVPQAPNSSSAIPTIAQGLSGTVLLAFVAAGIATGQSFILEPWLGGRIRIPWVVATVVAWVVGALLTGALQRWLPSAWSFLFLKLVFGAAVGFGQLLILKRTVPRAGLWVMISAVSLMAAESLSLTGMSSMVLLVPASALIYGALSGPGIVWLVLRQPALASPAVRPQPRPVRARDIA